MIQQDTAQNTAQATPPAPQPVAPEATPAAVPQEAAPATLHDFALNLLNDPAALDAFQLDPQGVLNSCGLGDLTAGDVEEILPLVLDAASVANVDAISGLTDIGVPATVTGLVDDFSGLGDVSSTLDGVLPNATDAVSGVTGIAQGSGLLAGATDVAGLANVADLGNVTDLAAGLGNVTNVAGLGNVTNVADLGNVTNVADLGNVTDLADLGNVTDLADLGNVTDVADLSHVTDVAKDAAQVTVGHEVDVIDNVVQNVGQVGDVQNTIGNVLGDVNIGNVGLLDDGLGNLNDVGLLHH